eukprot:6868059-Prymnesium_polylepis.1
MAPSTLARVVTTPPTPVREECALPQSASPRPVARLQDGGRRVPVCRPQGNKNCSCTVDGTTLHGAVASTAASAGWNGTVGVYVQAGCVESPPARRLRTIFACAFEN